MAKGNQCFAPMAPAGGPCPLFQLGCLRGDGLAGDELELDGLAGALGDSEFGGLVGKEGAEGRIFGVVVVEVLPGGEAVGGGGKADKTEAAVFIALDGLGAFAIGRQELGGGAGGEIAVPVAHRAGHSSPVFRRDDLESSTGAGG